MAQPTRSAPVAKWFLAVLVSYWAVASAILLARSSGSLQTALSEPGLILVRTIQQFPLVTIGVVAATALLLQRHRHKYGPPLSDRERALLRAARIVGLAAKWFLLVMGVAWAALSTWFVVSDGLTASALGGAAVVVLVFALVFACVTVPLFGALVFLAWRRSRAAARVPLAPTRPL